MRLRLPLVITRVGSMLLAALDNLGSSAGRVRAGQALLLLTGIITTATIGALDPSGSGLRALIAASVVLLSFVGLSPRLPWERWPSWVAVTYPLSVLAGLAAIGLADKQTAAAYSGLIVFCFVYVGLTQPPGTSLLLALPAGATWFALQGNWSATLAVRLAVALIIWITVGELLGTHTDREAEQRRTLSGKAETDPLTGLMNRRGLERRLRGVSPGDTVVMCDLDHFKFINDQRGHQVGDKVLADFGALLQAALRGQDLAVRYGGEEFLLLLATTSPEAALDVLARMRGTWATMQPGITFSSGIAVVSETVPVGTALIAADEALYVSKDAGRNCDHIAYRQIVRASL